MFVYLILHVFSTGVGSQGENGRGGGGEYTEGVKRPHSLNNALASMLEIHYAPLLSKSYW